MCSLFFPFLFYIAIACSHLSWRIIGLFLLFDNDLQLIPNMLTMDHKQCRNLISICHRPRPCYSSYFLKPYQSSPFNSCNTSITVCNYNLPISAQMLSIFSYLTKKKRKYSLYSEKLELLVIEKSLQWTVQIPAYAQ